jgi:hypothetical protein
MRAARIFYYAPIGIPNRATRGQECSCRWTASFSCVNPASASTYVRDKARSYKNVVWQVAAKGWYALDLDKTITAILAYTVYDGFNIAGSEIPRGPVAVGD